MPSRSNSSAKSPREIATPRALAEPVPHPEIHLRRRPRRSPLPDGASQSRSYRLRATAKKTASRAAFSSKDLVRERTFPDWNRPQRHSRFVEQSTNIQSHPAEATTTSQPPWRSDCNAAGRSMSNSIFWTIANTSSSLPESRQNSNAGLFEVRDGPSAIFDTIVGHIRRQQRLDRQLVEVVPSHRAMKSLTRIFGEAVRCSEIVAAPPTITGVRRSPI